MLISERQCIIPISPTCAYGIALFQYVPRVPMALYYSSIPTCTYGIVLFWYSCMCLWHSIIPVFLHVPTALYYSGIPICAYGTVLFQYSYMCLWHSTSLTAHLLDYTLTKQNFTKKKSLCTWIILPLKDRIIVFSNRNPER